MERDNTCLLCFVLMCIHVHKLCSVIWIALICRRKIRKCNTVLHIKRVSRDVIKLIPYSCVLFCVMSIVALVHACFCNSLHLGYSNS